jgi:hypothetical protein
MTPNVGLRASRPTEAVTTFSPADEATGPTDICSRGPMRAASAPDGAESASMITVSGSIAVPAALEAGTTPPERGVHDEGDGVRSWYDR